MRGFRRCASIQGIAYDPGPGPRYTRKIDAAKQVVTGQASPKL